MEPKTPKLDYSDVKWQGESQRKNLARQPSHIHVKQCPSCKG